MNLRINHVIDNTMTTATIVTAVLYACRLNIVVVMAPGPTRRGIAMGTAPRLSGECACSCMLPEIRILIAIIRKRMPHATSKLSIDIPKIVRISFPVKAKTSSRTKLTNGHLVYFLSLIIGHFFS